MVLVLADDLGYGDVHAFNPDSHIPTPHLDRLASEGLVFWDAHSPSAVCTPTRYGLLTGRYAWRTSLKRGVLDGWGEPLLEKDRPTLATFLAARGYRTGIVGKWHLGLGFAKTDDDRRAIDFTSPLDDTPNDHGFESSFVIPASLDFPPYVFLDDRRATDVDPIEQPGSSFPRFVRAGPRGKDLAFDACLDTLLVRAQRFLRAADERPFFLYFPLTGPHKPVWPHERFDGTTTLGPYGDFVHQVDWTVGAVMATLEATGHRDDTLLIVTSDNGSFMFSREDARDHVDDANLQQFRPERHRANGPWRGTKADIWEAGHRVPFFVRWPGRVAAGGTSDLPICHVDIFPTLVDLLDAPRPERACPDGQSFAATLRGDAQGERAPFALHSVNGTFAVRDGRWKLVLGNGSGGRERPVGKPFGRPYMLFDLHADPNERTNIAALHPDIAARLEAELERIRTLDQAK
ncbi:MAG: arylsulfatase [Planctomycetes bacterium]|nr:arylsulfatase [Planctomycetota bacterium]